MSDIVIIFGGAFVVAIIICIGIVKKELDKTNTEGIKRQSEYWKKESQKADEEVLKMFEDEEDDELEEDEEDDEE